MGFSIICTNVGCGKLQEPFLDPKDNKVYSSLCKKELKVTQFVVHQLKMNKLFKKKQKESFAVKCPHCDEEARPIIQNKDKVSGRKDENSI